MSINAITLAKTYHNNLERNQAAPVAWDDIPHDERREIIAAAEQTLEDLQTRPLIVELYSVGDHFPVDAQPTYLMPDASAVAPPPLTTSTETSFNMTPVDKARLEQALGILKQMGFVTQKVVVEYKIHDYTMIHLVFAQSADPRLTADAMDAMLREAPPRRCQVLTSPGPPLYASGCLLLQGHEGNCQFPTPEEARKHFYESMGQKVL